MEDIPEEAEPVVDIPVDDLYECAILVEDAALDHIQLEDSRVGDPPHVFH